MRLLTSLRRLDNSKKDTLILFSAFFITICIVILGFLYNKSSFYSTNESGENKKTTNTFGTFFAEVKSTMLPAFLNIKQNVNTVSEGYKKGTFTDYDVPKSE